MRVLPFEIKTQTSFHHLKQASDHRYDDPSSRSGSSLGSSLDGISPLDSSCLMNPRTVIVSPPQTACSVIRLGDRTGLLFNETEEEDRLRTLTTPPSRLSPSSSTHSLDHLENLASSLDDQLSRRSLSFFFFLF